MNTKKKILHLINDASLRRGGAQKIVNSLIEVQDFDSYTFSKKRIDNIVDERNFVGNNFDLLWKIRMKPDAVVIHSRMFWPYAFMIKKFGVKVIFYVHADYTTHNWAFRIFRPDSYIVTSNAVKNLLTKHGISEKKIHVNINPLVSDGITPLENITISQPLVISFVGSLEPRKGILDLIDLLKAYSIRGKMPIILQIIGEGSLYKKITLNMNNGGDYFSIRLLGYQERPYLTTKNSLIQIIPSLEEGFGLVGVEAILHGKLLVYNEIPALIELLGRDEFSFSFKIGSPDSFFIALDNCIYMLKNGSLGRKKAKERSDLISRKYSLDRFIKEYVKIVKKCIDS
ncbi:MAG: glycosyltransferase family 4 protein [Anaerolineales bacterium]|nr:glycosyltransferase family 4 protein [Anaerolineales bacterium]